MHTITVSEKGAMNLKNNLPRAKLRSFGLILLAKGIFKQPVTT